MCRLVWAGVLLTPCAHVQRTRETSSTLGPNPPPAPAVLTQDGKGSAATNSPPHWGPWKRPVCFCPSQDHRHALLPDGVLPRPCLQRPHSARLGAQPEVGHIHCHEQSLVQNSQCGLQGYGPRRLRETR